MTASKLQNQAKATERVTGYTTKASLKSITRSLYSYFFSLKNERKFSDQDLDRYKQVLESDQFGGDYTDGIIYTIKGFHYDEESIILVRTYISEGECYTCGEGLLFTMGENHDSLEDLVKDLIDIDYWPNLHLYEGKDPYIVETKSSDTTRPYMVVFTLRNYNRVKGLYSTFEQARDRAKKLNRLYRQTTSS